MDDGLLHETSKHFDNINFNEMDERWIDEAIANEFTDVHENPMSIDMVFADDPTEVLLNLSAVCEAWIEKGSNDDLEESNTGDISTRPEEILWTYLDNKEIKIKDIQGVIYLLCRNAVKTTSELEEKEIGLLSAKLYFNCLRVPGSTAYSVYHPSLFRACIDCFQVPDQVESKDAKYKWKDFEEIMLTFSLALESLVPLLGIFYLGNDTATVDYVIQKLSDLVGSEVSNSNLDFNLDFVKMPKKEKARRYRKTLVTTCLAYQGFTSLMNSDLNGDKENIYSVILSCLNSHILCTKVKKSPSISAKYLVVKDNAVAFLCHNLKGKDELISILTLTTLKRLCLMVSDKADFRHTVSHAVFKIMFCLRVQDVAELIKWLLVLIDASDAHHRVFALEMLGLLLTNLPEVDFEGLPESMEVYFTPVPIIYAILTRCDDASPAVRTKALGVISQHMTQVLKVLTEIQEPAIFPGEVFENEIEYKMNGDHRGFWYNFTSFQDTLKEIATIFHRRIEDNNGIARKAALQALENVITFDLAYLTKDNLKLFSIAAKDQNIVMRKQTVQSLTSILAKYPDKALSQEYWLKCILPLVQDPENTVQAKVLGAIEEKFLLDVFADADTQQEAAFCLLRKISTGDFLSHQRYLHKAFGCWKSENKLRPQMVNKLEKSFSRGNDDMIWLYLSIFAGFCKIPPKICKLAVEEFEKPLNWENYSFMENILKVIEFAFYNMLPDDLENVRSILIQKLEQYAAAVEILPIMIETLCKIEKHLDRQKQFAEFAAKMMKSSVDNLSPIVAVNRKENATTEDLAIKSFTVIKEFCHIFPAHITKNLVNLFKKFLCKPKTRGANASNMIVNPSLQAHAYAAVGRISLQEENLAKELLPHMGKQLRLSDEDRIRNNVVIVLIEMIKRYTSFADKYIPMIISCFKDKCYIIRHQSITLLVGLLQEDYIKCKGPLLHCILSTIIDEKESIQELGKFCLLHILLAKKSTIFVDNFGDTIFVLNGYEPDDSEKTQLMVKQLKDFALLGDGNREKRMRIYKFMLTHMELSHRLLIIKYFIQSLLPNVHCNRYILTETVEAIVRDGFEILTSTEIRAYDGDAAAADVEEEDEERVVTAEINARREILVKPLIPQIQLLRVCVFQNKRTSLLPDILDFMEELLQDYKSELDQLVTDKYLWNELTLRFKNEANAQQEAEAKSKTKDATLSKKSHREIVDQLISEDASMASPGPATASQSRRSGRGQAYSEAAVESDDEMEVDVASSSRKYPTLNDPLLSSTPRVVLKPLGKLDFPNVSRILDDSD